MYDPLLGLSNLFTVMSAVSLPFALVFVFIAVRGLLTGQVWLRSMMIDRSESPAGFWIGVGANLVCAIVIVATPFYIALTHAARP